MKTFVITGATGCLGMNLARVLLEKNRSFKIIALGRNQQLGEKLKQLGATFYAIDLNDPNSLKKVCADAEVIFHCAALSSAWGDYDDFYQTNVIGTENIIQATPKIARLIHVSSPSVYFNYQAQYNIDEEKILPTKQVNHYITTKRLAEKRVLEAVTQQHLDAIIIRPRGIFGPYDRALLPRVMKLYHNGKLPIIGSGKQLVDITYVDNVAHSLYLAALKTDIQSGRIYNITNGEPNPLIEILSMLFKELEKPVQFHHRAYWWIKPLSALLERLFKLPFINQEPPLTCYTAAVMALGQTLSIERARDELDYSPIVSLKEGIERFAKWSKTQ